jgi:hypothetical protein
MCPEGVKAWLSNLQWRRRVSLWRANGCADTQSAAFVGINRGRLCAGVGHENGGIKKKRGNWGKRKGARECEGVCGERVEDKEKTRTRGWDAKGAMAPLGELRQTRGMAWDGICYPNVGVYRRVGIDLGPMVSKAPGVKEGGRGTTVKGPQGINTSSPVCQTSQSARKAPRVCAKVTNLRGQAKGGGRVQVGG